MDREFIGTGWGFPVRTDDRGNVEMVSSEDSIERSVRLIIETAKGERVMRPEFGCDIHDHVFAAIAPATLNMMEESVREALVRFEPRIDVERIEATRDERKPNRVLIDIEYWIRSTNSRANMVYPFYLQEGER